MQSVTIDNARHLVAAGAVTRAVIEAIGSGRWCIVLRGRDEFRLKSARMDPKEFARVETALDELKGLGLRQAEIDFKKWDRRQSTIT